MSGDTRDPERGAGETADGEPTDDETTGDETVDEPADDEPAGDTPDDEPAGDDSLDPESVDDEPADDGSLDPGEGPVDDERDDDSGHPDTPATRVRLFNANEGDLLLDTAEQATPERGESADDEGPADERPDGDDYGPADVRRDYRDDVRLFADPERGVVTVYCNVNRVAPEQVLARVTVEPGPLPVVLGRTRAAVDQTLAARGWPVVADAEQPVFDALGVVRDSTVASGDTAERDEVDDEDAAAATALEEALGAVAPDGADAVTLAELTACSRATVVTPGERAAARLLPLVCRRWPDDTTLSVTGSPSDTRRTDAESSGTDTETDGATSHTASPDVALRPDVAADAVRLAGDTRRELAERRRRRLRVLAESLPDPTSVEFKSETGDGGRADSGERPDSDGSNGAPDRSAGVAGEDRSGVGSLTTDPVDSLGRAVRRYLPAVLVTAVVGWVATGPLPGSLAAVAAVLAGSTVAAGGAVVRGRRTHPH
ncbi:hypothetical protein RYH80_15230 [Halobaculum sp. MBLA0147]|uniref:hypothetical protein n=1 Tax=Halobaculum sp. MBLA0147 TaxID=3079934 RepID=UPI003524848A